jgi:transposase
MKLPEGIMTGKSIVGVDVAKEWLDLAVSGEARVERVANTREAVAAWIERATPQLVAFEPTGGYERILREGLREQGILFVRVHPNDLIAFRKSRGIKAKTDRIDAQLIAAFAAEELVRRGVTPAISGDETLRELAARRRQLVEALHAERCRIDLARSPAVRDSLTLLIDALAKSLAAVETELAAHIAAHPDTAALASLLRTVTGVGPIVATTLIADLPELGHVSGKEIASLVGLAPHTRQSGRTKHRERTGYGRPTVRRMLFNAARSAVRHSPPMRAFYDRLVSHNKRPGKVALTAVMRKILVTLNAIARDRSPWRLQTT